MVTSVSPRVGGQRLDSQNATVLDTLIHYWIYTPTGYGPGGILLGYWPGGACFLERAGLGGCFFAHRHPFASKGVRMDSTGAFRCGAVRARHVWWHFLEEATVVSEVRWHVSAPKFGVVGAIVDPSSQNILGRQCRLKPL